MKVELAPGFVVAMPSLRDPNFARTVVLLVEHGENGSLGFVVNRPSRLSFEQVADALGFEHREGPEEVAVFTGGPVAPQSGWILFDPRGVDQSDLDDALLIHDSLAVSASRTLLERIAREGAPGRCVLALGYAGWAEGQLDAEFRQGSWIPIELDPEIVFDTEPGERWTRVLAQSGIEPGRIVSAASGGEVS
ncbi:MAG: YqgE/AlgH family protein [Myxococcota bacterium]|nr:YqgE/AlgH family protein [Myxococcota bacterium]